MAFVQADGGRVEAEGGKFTAGGAEGTARTHEARRAGNLRLGETESFVIALRKGKCAKCSQNENADYLFHCFVFFTSLFIFYLHYTSRCCARRNCYWNCGKSFRQSRNCEKNCCLSRSFWMRNCCRNMNCGKRNFHLNRNFWMENCCQSRSCGMGCCRKSGCC